VGVAGIAFFALFDEPIISLFLQETESEGDLALTLAEGKRYLTVMLAGLLPFAFSNAYASTMRETGKTVVPMVASIVAVLTNFCFNYILIFGHFGAPALGVVGAAIATVISRFVELAVLVVWGHSHTKTYVFLAGAYRGLTVPGHLMGQIALKGLPLMFNEFFWSTAVTLRNQCYSTRGLEVVAAQNVASTIVNVFNVVFISLGSAVAIIIGNLLGAGKLEEAKDTDRKLLAFSVLSTLGMAVLLCVSSPFFPLLYKTSDAVRELATYMMIASAAIMPFCAFANAAYFTIRAGGNVIITLLFDSVFMWVIVMPAAFLLSRFTGIGIRPLYLICQATEIIKVVFGVALIRSGTWLRSLVGEEKPQEMS
ncbi:MAG: MATE family efflux transporter, partial [Ruminococcus sp.]|nr:MATE family efflux transporter [Candidatus Apopatosoma intestinale]